MEQLSERLQTPISTAELERRWAAVRAAMEREKIDVLLMQNNNDYMGGYVKYFTDLPATNGYPLTVVFPRDDLMTLVSMGRSAAPIIRPRTATASPRRQAMAHHAELRLVLLHRELRSRTRGQSAGALCRRHDRPSRHLSDVVRAGRLSAKRPFLQFALRRRLRSRRPHQGDQERRGARADPPRRPHAGWRHARGVCRRRAGMRDRDIAAIAQCYSQRHGSENGIYLCASMPPDKPAQFSQRHFQNRVIEKGDTVALLVEDSGPGGMYTELGRTCVVGKASAELKDEFAFALEARKFNLGLLKPGTPCKDIFAAYNDFMRKNGRPEESACIATARAMIWSNDRSSARRADGDRQRHEHRRAPDLYPRPRAVVGLRQLSDRGGGPSERLHRFPEIITELG
jgi:hypothetical protein